MKDSHLRTPRSIRECQWTHGYVCGNPETPMERVLGVALAVVIGVALAACLFYGLSS